MDKLPLMCKTIETTMIKSLFNLTFNQSVTGSNPVGLTTTLVRNTKKHEVKNIFNILHGTSTKRKMLLREPKIYLFGRTITPTEVDRSSKFKNQY